MLRLLIRQGMFLPLVGMLLPMFAGFFAPGYSSLAQQMSEMELTREPYISMVRLGALVCGGSILLFAVAMLAGPRKLPFTAICTMLFGSSMASNGVFLMGGPMHGLYGIGFFMVLMPGAFAAELREEPKAVRLHLAIAVVTLFYLWLMVTGLDPVGYHGLTQRIFVFPMFGWFYLAGRRLLQSEPAVGLATVPA